MKNAEFQENIQNKLGRNLVSPKYGVLIALGVLVLVLYGNTLGNGFVYDDKQQVVENKYIQHVQYLPKVITGCIWEFSFGQCKDRALYYRPFQSFSYLISYQISSSPWIFHLVNLVYFFGILALLFLVAQKLTSHTLFAALAAFLYALHPINTEVVNWVSAVPDLTFALFALFTVYLYLREKVWFAYGAYALALLSKEPALFLPAILLLVDLTYFRKPFASLFSLQSIRTYAGFALLAILSLVLRFAVLGSLFPQGATPHGAFTLAERVSTFFSLLGQYAGKLVFPHDLLFFYSFEKKAAFLSLEFFAGVLVILGAAAGGFLLWQKGKRLPALFLGWLLLFFLPVLLFLDSLGESVFAERYLFVPTIGFALLLAYAATFVWQKMGRKEMRFALAGFLALAVTVAFVQIIQRNQDFADNQALYDKTLEQNPSAYPIRFNKGVYLRSEKNDFEGAKKEFETILEQNPNWGDAMLLYMHLGDYYRDVAGDEEQALVQYKKSVQAAGNIWKGHFAYDRIGGILASGGGYLASVPYFCSATQLSEAAKDSAARMERATGLALAEYEDKPKELYDAVRQSFEKSSIESIRHIRTMCQGETCQYVFSMRFEQEQEVILPSFLAAATAGGQGVEILRSGLQAQGAEAVLEVSATYEDSELSFVFPACSGRYYEAAVRPKENI